MLLATMSKYQQRELMKQRELERMERQEQKEKELNEKTNMYATMVLFVNYLLIVIGFLLLSTMDFKLLHHNYTVISVVFMILFTVTNIIIKCVIANSTGEVKSANVNSIIGLLVMISSFVLLYYIYI